MDPGTHITVHVPGPLRAYCAGAKELAVLAANVQAALLELARQYPLLYAGVCHETGAVRRHINLFVNTNNVRDLQGLDTPLAPGDVLVILPSVSGG